MGQSELSQTFGAFEAERKERRFDRLARRTAKIMELEAEGFRIEALSPYQFRINGVVDLYPLSGRFHILKENRRGTAECLKRWVQENVKR